MPSIHLCPPSSAAFLRRSHRRHSPPPVWRCALPRQVRTPSEAVWFRGGRWRSFRALEAGRNREKCGSLEGPGEEESGAEEKDGVVEEERDRMAQQKAPANGRVVEKRTRSGVSNAPPVGSLELLAIPGVGPRNLIKLVDKGFQGMAQLKQLYRDKVYSLLYNMCIVS